MLIDLIVVLILVVFDQVVKHWTVINQLDLNPIVIIDGVFELTYVKNYGAAWGRFSGQTMFLLTVTVLLMVGIVYVYYKMPKTKRYNYLKITVILIFSGAIGNFVDRIRLGYVVDMLYFKLIDFPVFNVADSYVVVGSIVLIVLTMFYYKDEEFEFVKLKRGKNEQL